MIEPQSWVAEARTRLQKTFGPRLLYLGLQGSYRRGEATESSDIDLVTILDTVTLADLDAYREAVRPLPEGEKACGFLCGAADFAHWPRHELFPFRMDTVDVHGELDAFLPAVTPDDIRENVRIGASALLHFLTHSYIYAPPESRAEILKGAYKSAYFTLQVSHYLSTGKYYTSKRDLLAHLDGTEKEILTAGMDFAAWLASHTEHQAFDMLLAWCRTTLCSV